MCTCLEAVLSRTWPTSADMCSDHGEIMAIVQVIIPDDDIDIPLAELVRIIRERLEYGRMDGFNRYFAHMAVKAARPRRATAKEGRGNSCVRT